MKNIFSYITLLVTFISIGQNMFLDPTFGNNGTLIDASINAAPINIYFENNNYFLINYSNSIACLNYDGSKNVNFANNGILFFNGANETFLTKGSKYWNGFFYIFGQVVYGSSSSSKDFFIVKISLAGILDASFGSNGVVKQDFGGDEVLNDILILDDEKIIGVGSKYISSSKLFVTKYNANGTIDTNFDISGYKILTANSNESSYGSNLFNFENNLLVVGKSSFSLGQNLVLIKMDSNGNYITTFGTNGVKQFQLASQSSTASYSVFNTSLINGNDLYFGLHFAASFSTQDKTLKKYDINNNTMISIGSLPFSYPFYVLDSNQKIYITGTERCSPNTASNCSRNFNLYRRNISGIVDTSFNTNGSFSYNFFPSDLISDDMSSAVYLHSDGKIFMAGVGYNPFSTNGTGLEMLRLTQTPLSVVENQNSKPEITNPVSNELIIENLNDRIIKEIKIYNLLGKEVFATKENISRINVSFLQEGIYLAKINIDELDYSVKIFKK